MTYTHMHNRLCLVPSVAQSVCRSKTTELVKDNFTVARVLQKRHGNRTKWKASDAIGLLAR